MGKLDIQGPKSGEVSREYFGDGIKDLSYYTFNRALPMG